MKSLILTVVSSCLMLAIAAPVSASETRTARKNLEHSRNAQARMNPLERGAVYPAVSHTEAERYGNGAVPILAGH